MRDTRVFFVTGKGGVGKTTISSALGLHAASLGQRVLIVETASDGSLTRIFGKPRLGAVPHELSEGLFGVRIDPPRLVEDYFSKLLRVRWLTHRLLSSSTFTAVTTAAPGLTEFLLLDRILDWMEPGLTGRRRRFDLVIVDGPATGHAIQLLRTPRNLAALVPAGPFGKTSRRLISMLADAQRTAVILVALAEEMVVRETVEAHDMIKNDLRLRVTCTVVNRVFPRNFSAADESSIRSRRHGGPIWEAARFAIGLRREAERHVTSLRRALGASPVLIPQIFAPEVHPSDLKAVGNRMFRALKRDGIV